MIILFKHKHIFLVLLSLLICIIAISSVSAADNATVDDLSAGEIAVDEDLNNDNVLNSEDDNVGAGEEKVADAAQGGAGRDDEDEISQDNADEVLSDTYPSSDSYSVSVNDVTAYKGDKVTIPIKITPNSDTAYKYDFYIFIQDKNGWNIVGNDEGDGCMSTSSNDPDDVADRVYGTTEKTSYNYAPNKLKYLDKGNYKIKIVNQLDNEVMDTATLTIKEHSLKVTINKKVDSEGVKFTVKVIDADTKKPMKNKEVYIKIFEKGLYSVPTNSNGVATYQTKLKSGSYSAKVMLFLDNCEDYESSIMYFKVVKNAKISISQSGKYYLDKKVKVKLINSATKKAVKSQKVKIKFSNGKTLVEKTNSKGVATFNVDFKPGKYSASVSLPGNDVSAKSKKISNINIKKANVKINSKKVKTTYESGKYFVIKVVNKATGKAVKGVKIKIKIKGGKTTTKTSGADGKIKVSTSKLGVGTHKVTMKIASKNLVTGKSKTNKIIIKKAGIKVNAPNSLNCYKQNDKYIVKVKNKDSNKPVKGVKVTMKVFTGSNYKKYTVKTNSKGIASFNTKSLSKGKHKVSVSVKGDKYYKSAKDKGSVKMVNKLKTRIVCGEPDVRGVGSTIRDAYGRVIASGLAYVTHIFLEIKMYDSNGNELFKSVKVTNSEGKTTTCRSGPTNYIPTDRGVVTVVFAGDSKYMSSRATVRIN